VHQPVSEGDCVSCHDPHAADRPKLVAKPVPAVCYECHELADLQKVERHKEATDKTACLLCHFPHQSGREHLLKGRDKTRSAGLKE
jgi:predicted CXXCH cytochrome family protein